MITCTWSNVSKSKLRLKSIHSALMNIAPISLRMHGLHKKFSINWSEKEPTKAVRFYMNSLIWPRVQRCVSQPHSSIDCISWQRAMLSFGLDVSMTWKWLWSHINVCMSLSGHLCTKCIIVETLYSAGCLEINFGRFYALRITIVISEWCRFICK